MVEGPDGKPHCPLLAEFQSLVVGYGKAVTGLLELFKRIEKPGPIALGVKLFHNVDKNSKIYEFVKGDLRLFCFMAPDGAICVCSTVVVKKGRKANKSAVKRTAQLSKEYNEAHKSNLIEFYTVDKEGNLIREKL